MNEDSFWSFIEQSRQVEQNLLPGQIRLPYPEFREKQLKAITHLLQDLSAEDVAAYQKQFERAKNRAYSWDMWGIAYILQGGCSDDGFDYFRCWLISLGREHFDQLLADPEAFINHEVLDGPSRWEGELEFEEFGVIGYEVFRQKAGEIAMPGLEPNNILEPSGEIWQEDELHKRFPRIYARYG